jgi:hypothetical protein
MMDTVCGIAVCGIAVWLGTMTGRGAGRKTGNENGSDLEARQWRRP